MGTSAPTGKVSFIVLLSAYRYSATRLDDCKIVILAFLNTGLGSKGYMMRSLNGYVLFIVSNIPPV